MTTLADLLFLMKGDYLVHLGEVYTDPRVWGCEVSLHARPPSKGH